MISPKQVPGKTYRVLQIFVIRRPIYFLQWNALQRMSTV